MAMAIIQLARIFANFFAGVGYAKFWHRQITAASLELYALLWLIDNRVHDSRAP